MLFFGSLPRRLQAREVGERGMLEMERSNVSDSIALKCSTGGCCFLELGSVWPGLDEAKDGNRLTRTIGKVAVIHFL